MLAAMREPVFGTQPAGAYSPGIIAEGRFLYVAGQAPFRDGVPELGSIEDETRLTLANLRTIIEGAGATLADVVRCGVYLADIGDFAAMNGVYAEFFSQPYPARTTIACALAGGIKVEIDCVVVLPSA